MVSESALVMKENALDALLDVDLPAELMRLVAQIPRGRVSTYGTIADALGDRVAARWVGEALLNHQHGPECTCHRVVRKSGDPGLYINGDSASKLARLAEEDVPTKDGRASVANVYTAFNSDAPLRRLKEFQNGVRPRLDLRPWREPINRVAALDVAYVSDRKAVAACVIADFHSNETIATRTLEMPVRFPYVSGYLAFRELPAMLALWRAVGEDAPAADVVLIDGNGILHPRRAGIAACFGLIADVPTIGIGKSLLCGSVDLESLRAGSSQPVIHDDELIGLAVKATDRSRPIFVSPGNHCDAPQAAAIVQQLFAGHRLPEPLHQADRLTKQRVRDLRAAEASAG